jgi:hypothetical protein
MIVKVEIVSLRSTDHPVNQIVDSMRYEANPRYISVQSFFKNRCDSLERRAINLRV